MRTLTASTNIVHAFSATYHPETNGQVERFNATFCTQLAKYYDATSDDWDHYLPSVIHAYNTGIHSTTGFAPYELAFGRRPKSPFDHVSTHLTLTEPNRFYQDLQRTREIVLQHAQRNIRHQHVLTKQRYDRRRKDISYSANDLVFLKVYGNRTKFDERWIGPCRVLEITGKQNYLVEENETGRVTTAHVHQLRPVISRCT